MKIKIKNYLIKNKIILLILFFSFISKFILIYPNYIPFAFDHGKDSLAILHMIKTGSPKLIGPWTSIPGLYFGPAWYYLLAPFYMVGNGNPIWAVIPMIILNLIMVYLAYRYFGKLEALIFACAQAWITLSTSAWNPFPMPLLMLIILINLRKEKLTKQNIFIIFLSISLSFHFSSAYALFYLLIIPILLIYRLLKENNKVKIKLIISGLLGFLIPFIPQVLFELRHNFIETRAVISYLLNSPENQTKVQLLDILRISLGEIKSGLVPQISGLGNLLNKVIFIFSLILLVIGIFKVIKNKIKIKFGLEFLLLVFTPVIGFYFLHFNVWYCYAMLSLAVIFLTQFIKQNPKYLQIIFIILLILTPISKVYVNFKSERTVFKKSRAFLPIKIKAIERVRHLSENKSFSSYHYVPDIYDYSYQYLYLWKAFNGEKLPYEFAYEPGKIDYIKEKPDLINKVESFKEKPESIFYIVEKPENKIFLERWWNNQNYKEIVYEEKISDEVIIYKATVNDLVN